MHTAPEGGICSFRILEDVFAAAVCFYNFGEIEAAQYAILTRTNNI